MEHALFEAERMTLAEALSMYTLEAAYAARAEEPGLALGWIHGYGQSCGTVVK